MWCNLILVNFATFFFIRGVLVESTSSEFNQMHFAENISETRASSFISLPYDIKGFAEKSDVYESKDLIFYYSFTRTFKCFELI